MTELAAKPVRVLRLPGPWTVAAALVAAAASTFLVGVLAHRGETMPGVRVAGADVGGLPRAHAQEAIQASVAQRLARPIGIRVGGDVVVVRPRTLFALNLVETTRRAMLAGRATEPERIAAMVSREPRDVRPALVGRAEGTAELIAAVRAHGARAQRPATVVMNGTEPTVVAGRPGATLDAQSLIGDIRAAALEGGSRTVTARFIPVPPRPSNAAAAAAAATARELVSAPVYLHFKQRPVGELSPEELAGLLRFRASGDAYVVGFDTRSVARVVDPLIAPWKRRAVNARFLIDGERVSVIPSQPGIGLSRLAVAGEVTAAAYSPTIRVADISLRQVPADITTRELTSLRITRRLSSFTTDMGVSSSNRIWNVQLMANYIDGTIIRPGETFSFNGVVGPRTVERGFREGQMIIGSLLVPSIGGGVCQTATTLFNNAFELGLPIVERHNHSFYISHYPLGRDATVSWGGPDLVFRNDLKSALLIKSSYTSETLTFTFYGAPHGRRVEAATSERTSWRAPSTAYAYDPYAPAGSIRTESGDQQSGFDVTVRRTVYANGKVLRRDAFPSRYIPVGSTIVYGPGTNPPRVDFVLPPPE